jgi:cytochrome b6-f complex iron-sulfur subunit
MSDVTNCSGCAARAGVSRREFLSTATLSAVALTLAACGSGGGGDDDITGPVPPGVGEITVRVADFPALANVGGVARVRTSPAVAMTRTSTGFVAFSLSCTHQGTIVLINGNNTLQCPNHGAEFTSAGVWTGGQRTSNLVRLPVVTDATGVNATITLG